MSVLKTCYVNVHMLIKLILTDSVYNCICDLEGVRGNTVWLVAYKKKNNNK